jgi:hypothetical protein
MYILSKSICCCKTSKAELARKCNTHELIYVIFSNVEKHLGFIITGQLLNTRVSADCLGQTEHAS